MQRHFACAWQRRPRSGCRSRPRDMECEAERELDCELDYARLKAPRAILLSMSMLSMCMTASSRCPHAARRSISILCRSCRCAYQRRRSPHSSPLASARSASCFGSVVKALPLALVAMEVEWCRRLGRRCAAVGVMWRLQRDGRRRRGSSRECVDPRRTPARQGQPVAHDPSAANRQHPWRQMSCAGSTRRSGWYLRNSFHCARVRKSCCEGSSTALSRGLRRSWPPAANSSIDCHAISTGGARRFARRAGSFAMRNCQRISRPMRSRCIGRERHARARGRPQGSSPSSCSSLRARVHGGRCSGGCCTHASSAWRLTMAWRRSAADSRTRCVCDAGNDRCWRAFIRLRHSRSSASRPPRRCSRARRPYAEDRSLERSRSSPQAGWRSLPAVRRGARPRTQASCRPSRGSGSIFLHRAAHASPSGDMAVVAGCTPRGLFARSRPMPIHQACASPSSARPRSSAIPRLRFSAAVPTASSWRGVWRSGWRGVSHAWVPGSPQASEAASAASEPLSPWPLKWDGPRPSHRPCTGEAEHGACARSMGGSGSPRHGGAARTPMVARVKGMWRQGASMDGCASVEGCGSSCAGPRRSDAAALQASRRRTRQIARTARVTSHGSCAVRRRFAAESNSRCSVRGARLCLTDPLDVDPRGIPAGGVGFNSLYRCGYSFVSPPCHPGAARIFGPGDPSDRA